MPVDVRGDDALERRAVLRGAAGRHGLEDQQHPAREVLIGVFVETDAASEFGNVHRSTERALTARLGAMAAHHVGEIFEVGSDRCAFHLRIECKLRARDGDRRLAWRASGRAVDQQPVQIGDGGHLGAPPGAEQNDAGLLGQTQLREVAAQLAESLLAALPRGQERGEARGAARREMLKRTEGRRAAAVVHARQPARRRAVAAS